MTKKTPKDVDRYLAGFPPAVRARLEQIRKTIRKAAPEAEEAISYQMPAYKFHGVLVYFAGYENHVGFYPTTSAIREFKQALAVYEGSKGTVRFLHGEKLPLGLIGRMVKFRVRENLSKIAARKAKRRAL